MKHELVQAKTYIDKNTKREIDSLTKNWGMNTSVYLRLAIKQAINDQSIPFKIGNRIHVSYAKPNKETKLAENEKRSYKYNDMNKMFKDLIKK